MKKLVKFTTKEVVKEIELPAYFSHSATFTPSKADQNGGYFSAIVKITDAECRAKCISHGGYGGVQFGRSPWENGEVLQNFTQVPELEWLKAVEYVKRDIDN